MAAARGQGLEARLLVPLTRPPGGPALQDELVLADLDAVEAFREEGVGGEASTHAWLRDLSTILLEPPEVELLRVAAISAQPEGQVGLRRPQLNAGGDQSHEGNWCAVP